MGVVGDDGLAAGQSVEIGGIVLGAQLGAGAVPLSAKLEEIHTADGRARLAVTPQAHPLDAHEPCGRFGDELEGLL